MHNPHFISIPVDFNKYSTKDIFSLVESGIEDNIGTTYADYYEIIGFIADNGTVHRFSKEPFLGMFNNGFGVLNDGQSFEEIKEKIYRILYETIYNGISFSAIKPLLENLENLDDINQLSMVKNYLEQNISRLQFEKDNNVKDGKFDIFDICHNDFVFHEVGVSTSLPDLSGESNSNVLVLVNFHS